MGNYNDTLSVALETIPVFTLPESGELFHSISHRRTLVSLDVVAVSVYSWDLLLTTHLDIEYVWSTKLTTIKVIYVIQRYLPILSAGWALLYEELSYDIDLRTCHAVSEFGGFAIMTGYLAGEFILTMRTWAAWNRHKGLGIALGTAFVIIAIANYVIMYFYQRSFIFKNRPISVVTGCMIDVTWRGSRVIWATFLGWNTLLLMLILTPTIRNARTQGGTCLFLSSAVYLKGTLYYFLTFLLSILSLLIDTALPASYIPLFRGMQPCLYSMFTSKAILAIWSTTTAAEQNISQICVDFCESKTESTTSESLEDQAPYPRDRMRRPNDDPC